MGTRADFYVGRGIEAEWLGSIAWDGYPEGIERAILHAETEREFRDALNGFVRNRRDWTAPERGWPWPWDDSQTTDYAYAFDGGVVYGCCFGHGWFDATLPEPDEHPAEKTATFPNMAHRQNVTFGKRSGTIVVGPRGIVDED